jgi:predicted small secreted protein
MFTFTKLTMIKKLTIVAIAGIVISACSSTLEGVGKDLQNMGNSMGGSKSTTTNNPPPNPPPNQSQTTGKDVVVTPIK